MNLALFFEGTGQGVRGKRTNVSLVHDDRIYINAVVCVKRLVLSSDEDSVGREG